MAYKLGKNAYLWELLGCSGVGRGLGWQIVGVFQGGWGVVETFMVGNPGG